MASNINETLNLCKKIASRISSETGIPRKEGVFRLLAVKTVTFEHPRRGLLLLATAQERNSQGLMTIVGYHGTCGCLMDLLEVSTPCAIRITDYQVLGERKIQLLKSSAIVAIGDSHDFPAIAVSQIEDLVAGDGKCPVLTGDVFIERTRMSSNKAVYPVCAKCRAAWVNEELHCGFCGAATPTVQLICIISIRNEQGADIRAFCDVSGLSAIYNLPGDVNKFLSESQDMAFLERSVQDRWQLVLSARHLKKGGQLPEVLYNVEKVFRVGEVPVGEEGGRGRKKRR